jgi:excisionase family DNA binding protein
MPHRNENDGQDLLTTSAAATALGVSVRTIYRYEASGVLTAVRTPGGHRRFRRAELDAALTPAPRTAA